MCPLCNRLVAIVPALALTVGVIALAGGSFTGASAPDRVQADGPTAAVAPAPEGLSTATTTRDWQETSGSPTRRAWR